MGKLFVQPLRWWAESAPSPWLHMVKISKNLDVTAVIPVAPVDTRVVGRSENPGVPVLSSWNESQLSTWAH